MRSVLDEAHESDHAHGSRSALVGSSWALFDAMAEAVSDAVLLVDDQSRIEFCNARTGSLFGYAQDELVGAPLKMLVAPVDRARQGQQFADFLACDHVSTPQLTLTLLGQTRRASEVPIELRLTPVDRMDRALVMVAIRDASERGVAERRRSSQALEAAREQLPVDRAENSTALLDRDGLVTATNEAWRQLGRQGATDAILWASEGSSFVDACARSENGAGADVRRGVLALLRSERASFEQVYRCHTSTHLRWFHLFAQVLESQTGEVLVSQVDVTNVQLAYARLNIQTAAAKAFTAKLSLLAACRQLAVTLCEELDWEFAGIWTLDASSWTLRCVDSWIRPGLSLIPFESASRSAALGPGSGLPGRAWATAQVQWVNDVDTDPEIRYQGSTSSTVMPPAALSSGFRTALCFPLKCSGDVLAVVEVFSRIKRPKDRALMDLLEVCGEQLALWELRERAEGAALVAQEEAHDARMQLESVLDCTPAFITAIDRNGRLLFVNKTIPRERKANALGAPWRDFILPESQAQVEAALRGVFTSGAAATYEAKVALPDGKWLWFDNYMGPMRNGDAIVGAVIVSQDVTAAKHSREELLAAQRLAAVGTLAAGVAHEINTPIQFINDSIHFLNDATQDVFGLIAKLQEFHRLCSAQSDPEQRESASAAVSEAEETADLDYMHTHIPKAFERCLDGLERVATIVRSMKEFAHPAQRDMAPVDINRAISATLTVARNEYKYVADLETDLGPLPPVMCHANEINQVVLNIVVNAAHAIGEAAREGERGRITVSTRCEGDWVVISIGDTGGGIPEAIRAHVFDPFFTTKEVGRGTGQGLSMAWAAVKENHHGDLSFDTVIGQGTTFHIRLPVAGLPGGAP